MTASKQRPGLFYSFDAIVHRVLFLGKSGPGTIVHDFNFTKCSTNFAIDIFCAMFNMFAAIKNSARRLMNTGGVMVIIFTCEKVRSGSGIVQESFRGTLIMSLLGISSRDGCE